MALKVTKSFEDTFNYKGQEVTIKVVREEGKARRRDGWREVSYTSGSCSMFPDTEWSPTSIYAGSADTMLIDFQNMDTLVTAAMDDFLGKTNNNYEVEKEDILSMASRMAEAVNHELNHEEKEIETGLKAGKFHSLNDLVDYLEQNKVRYPEINKLDGADMDDFLFWADEIITDLYLGSDEDVVG